MIVQHARTTRLMALLAMLAAAGSASAMTHEVLVRDLTFHPANITVAPGDTVRWVLDSADFHTVTSGTNCAHDGLYFDEPINPNNPVFEWVVPDGVDEVQYFCIPHCFMGMVGTIQIDADAVDFEMSLDGIQEVPIVHTAASGSGTARYYPSTGEFTWHITFEDLGSAETAAHFHGTAPECENAGVVIPLDLGSPKIGSAMINPQQAEDLMKGLWYVNIHTQQYPGGEIRSQVWPPPLPDALPPIAQGNLHIELVTVAEGLTAPNWATPLPGHDDILIITDQDGITWWLDLDTGDIDVFLDVGHRLVDLGIGGPGTFDERGLLGIAFHPDYENNGKLYTYTSEPVSGNADFSTIPDGHMANHQSIILEWQVPNPGNPDSVVDPGSAREVMRVDQPQFNHNGGALSFGPDGMLYIAFGDGGGADDKDGRPSQGVPMIGHGCRGNGQNPHTILGAIARIDVDGDNSANGQYGIPGDNPYLDGSGLDENWAIGLRNPWRISFDRMTGEMYIGDVGQHDIEEINIGMPGANYGWNYMEGSFYFITNGASRAYISDRELEVPDDLVDPIAEYHNPTDGTAIIGGFVHRSSFDKALSGRYIFGDFRIQGGTGRLFYLDESNDIREFQLIGQDNFGFALLGFGEDAQGNIYALANEPGTPFGDTGVVLRIKTLTGDLNGDGCVGHADLAILLSSYGVDDGGDLNGDGVTGHADLAILLSNWGQGC